MKKALTILLAVVLVVLVVAVSFNFVVKSAIETGARLVTGLELKIGHFDLNFLKNSLTIKNLKLFNPRKFKDRVMLDIPEIYVDYRVAPLLKGKVHVEEMRFNMKEFVVVKNKEGAMNLDSLKAIEKKPTPSAKPTRKEKKAAKAAEIQVDNLSFRLDKVVYKDYSKETPYEKDFNINLNEKHENIQNLNLIISLIVSKALMKTTIASLSGFDIGGLQDSVSQGLTSSKEAAAKAAQVAEAKTKETLSVASEKTKSVAAGLKSKIKNPFSKEK